MHELAIAEDLAGIVLDEAHKNNLSKVTKVNICFGELVQIVPEIFTFAFSEVVRGTIADGSDVEIEITDIRMRCSNCGNEFMVEDLDFSCNVCHSTDITFISGKELFVTSIEGE